MSLLPRNIAPSAITILGARMLPVSRPVAWISTRVGGLAVADQLAAHDDDWASTVALHDAAGADAQVAGDADLALDGALDEHVLVAGDLALDRGLGADHAGVPGWRAAAGGAGAPRCAGGGGLAGAARARTALRRLGVRGFPKIPMVPPGGSLAGPVGAGTLERATGFEPATPSLGSSYSTN